jgi:hypothetical protein
MAGSIAHCGTKISSQVYMNNFNLGVTLRKVAVHRALEVVRTSCCQVISLARCILIRISVTLSDMSDHLLPRSNVVIELHL